MNGDPLISRMMRGLRFGNSVPPGGWFSFSNALGPAVQENVVRDETTLRELRTGRFTRGSTARRLRRMTVRMGRKLAEVTASAVRSPLVGQWLGYGKAIPLAATPSA